MSRKYDFSGWATKNDLKCSDGRTIRKNAFKDNDGTVVPLVWNHQHNDPENVLGHALLENREDGVYAYGTFNDTEAGRTAKSLVEHGDVSALSIYANRLKHQGSNVYHGLIREVSLVLAGANPGAFIDSLSIEHSFEEDYEIEEAVIYTDETIKHGFEDDEEETVEEPVEDQEEIEDDTETDEASEDLEHSEKNQNEEKKDMAEDKTVQEVFDSMTEDQKKVVYLLVGEAAKQAEGGAEVKHNVFENDYEEDVLTHADMEEIFSDAKRIGSLKESVLEHGITNIGYLFPEEKNIDSSPRWIKRDTSWVSKVMGGVHHSPFSRIKSLFADITADEARAKGYIKGNLKTEEVFTLLKRTTTPTTIYKKQKIDRDDMIDITDFNVVSWIKGEMRGMLDEEIARAILVGDGRLSSSNDKINEQNIRPIWTDADLYTIKAKVELPTGTAATATNKAKQFIPTVIRQRKNYKGTGIPTLFTTEDMLTEMLLLEDTIGHALYDSVEKLATKLRVKEIVTVPSMAGLTRTVTVSGTAYTHELLGIVVNLDDYNIGADKGGEVNMFDDFDIDYNAQKYLMETRCSGAMIQPYGAMVLEYATTATTQTTNTDTTADTE